MALKTMMKKSSSGSVAQKHLDQSAHHQSSMATNNQAQQQRRRASSMMSRNSSALSSFSSNHSSDVLPQIDEGTQSLVVKAANYRKDTFREKLPESLLSSHDGRDVIAPFLREELVLGPKLGTGEFSNVFEVSSINLDETQGRPSLTGSITINEQGDDLVLADNDISESTKTHTTTHSEEDELDWARVQQQQISSLSPNELNKRKHMKQCETYRATEKARYAIKHIKDTYFRDNDPESYIQAASDLALEAEFLASLVHPHIIKLRGISKGGASGFENGPSGYFLVLDRLFDTLDSRIRKWKVNNKSSRNGHVSKLRRSISRSLPSSLSSNTSKRSSSSNNKEKETEIKDKDEIMDEKLSVAFQITAAMRYLHSHSIIFRDLKPTNIGFDVRGDVKIFDFGLARIMPENGDPNNDLFDMSGAGSPRYMAPECLDHKPYNLMADVYSFSIILWEILSESAPFSAVKRRRTLIQQVVHENVRPSINKRRWPASIVGMLESSFEAEIGLRPKMNLWYEVVREELASLRGGERRGLNESSVTRRRSFESMRNIFSNIDMNGSSEKNSMGNSGSRFSRRPPSHTKSSGSSN